MSRLTLEKSFFDYLWPLVLSDNACDISGNFYDPDQLLDNIKLHNYLAERGFKNFQPPAALRNCVDEEEGPQLNEPSIVGAFEAKEQKLCTQLEYEHSHESDAELYQPMKLNIPSLEEQSTQIYMDFYHRENLANAFINRQYPWYMQRPAYESISVVNNSIRQEFRSKLERDVIEDKLKYNCKLLIIDFGERICEHTLRDWLKFTCYSFVIFVVRSEDVMRQIQLMGPNLDALTLVENAEFTWQEILGESLRISVERAKEIGEFDNCIESFVFIFSRKRNSCKLDTHRVLARKA